MKEAPLNSVHPLSRAEWRTWLAENHTRAEGIWLVSYKKATGRPRFDYDEAVEEALCFGWIDSKPNKLDEERSLLWFAPRKAGTGWSKINKERVDSIETLETPPDLAAALAAYPTATAYFDAFPRSVKRGILEWIATAKTAATRTKRITETATLAAENKRANQWRT